MRASEALVVEDVSAGYGDVPVLEGVSLWVDAGEVVGVVGPNGSGKTTLLRVCSRALAPAEGTVRVQGRDPYAVRQREAARIVAVVPQELAPAFPFTVFETVLLGRAPYLSPWGGGTQADWDRVRDAMESANVQHLAERRLDELSGGEKQRVVLAQALAQDAPVLLLDEPTTHLDLRHVVETLDLVSSLAKTESKAVLAVFHDLNLASAVCDRVYALAGGRVVASGRPEEVITRPLLGEVYGVEAEVYPHVLTGRPTVVLGHRPQPRAPRTDRPRAHVVPGAGRGASVMRALAERGYEVSAGVLHATDSDALVAEALALVRVTVPPFSAIDDASAQETFELMDQAEVVVVVDAPYGPGNLANLRLARRAQERGARVVLIEELPIAERDFTGGEATRLWQELATGAERIASGSELSARPV